MLNLRIEDLVYTFYHIPMAIVAPFISWYYFSLSGGEWVGTGLIVAIPYVTLIFSTRYFGILSDRVGSKKLIKFSLIALTLSYLIYFYIPDNAFLFFLANISLNLLVSAFIPSFNWHVSFQNQISKTKSFGNLATFASIGFLSGSFMASILISDLGFRNLFLFACVFSFITLILSFRLNENPLNQEIILHPNSSCSNQSSHLHKSIYILLILVILTQMVNGLFVGFFAIFVESELNYGITWVAILNTIATLFGAFSTFILGRLADRTSRKKLFLIGTIIYTSLPLVSYIFSNPITPELFPITLYLYAIPLYSIFFVLTPVYISENSSNNQRGRIMGMYSSSQYIGQTTGVMIGAFFASINGLIRPNFLLASVVGTISILICAILFQEPE